MCEKTHKKFMYRQMTLKLYASIEKQISILFSYGLAYMDMKLENCLMHRPYKEPYHFDPFKD